VLCYHAVSDLAGTRLAEYGVPAADLRRQLRLLRRVGYRFITLDEALRAVQGEPGVPRRAVLVTFDDCYSDLLTDGLPVLHEEDVPAVAYAVAERLGEVNAWDVAIGAPELPLLDAAGLDTLREAGISIGVHGATHVPLPRVSNQPATLAAETAGATRTLRAVAPDELRTFAYPHGEHDATVRAAVAAAGLEAAFTVTPGIVRPDADPYRLPRIEILRSDGAGLRFLIKVWTGGRVSVAPPSRTVRSARSLLRRVRQKVVRTPR
jgi:peptidoglycan/xylan/chitin deacetylase (PgdA/CDA1 family)